MMNCKNRYYYYTVVLLESFSFIGNTVQIIADVTGLFNFIEQKYQITILKTPMYEIYIRFLN